MLLIAETAWVASAQSGALSGVPVRALTADFIGGVQLRLAKPRPCRVVGLGDVGEEMREERHVDRRCGGVASCESVQGGRVVLGDTLDGTAVDRHVVVHVLPPARAILSALDRVRVVGVWERQIAVEPGGTPTGGVEDVQRLVHDPVVCRVAVASVSPTRDGPRCGDNE